MLRNNTLKQHDFIISTRPSLAATTSTSHLANRFAVSTQKNKCFIKYYNLMPLSESPIQTYFLTSLSSPQNNPTDA